MKSRPRLQVDAPFEARRLVRAQVRLVDARLALWEQDVHDGRALHGTRTALRRLRVLIRCFRPELGPAARGGIRRRLREAFVATSELRDLEVFATWVATLPASPAARHLAAGADVAAEASAAAAAVAMRRAWDAARRRLRAAHTAKTPARLPARGFGAAAATALRVELRTLSAGLAAFDPVGAPDLVHETRIAAKRTRYLVEALVVRSPDARRIVEWCRAFQDLVGEWRDSTLAVGPVRSCPVEPGRDLVARRLAERRRRALTAVRRFAADTAAFQIAKRDGLAMARRYTLASRRLPRVRPGAA